LFPLSHSRLLLSHQIVHQEKTFKERLAESEASREDQLSAIYSRLSKTTAQNTSATRTMQSALRGLNEIDRILCTWTGAATALSEDETGDDQLSESLELAVSQVQSEVQVLSEDLLRFREICRSFSADSLSALKNLANLSQDLPSTIRESCVREICQLESMDLTQGEPSGLKGDMALMVRLQRQSRSCDEINRRFCDELLRAQSTLREEHENKLQATLAQLEDGHRDQILTLQDCHHTELAALKVASCLSDCLPLPPILTSLSCLVLQEEIESLWLSNASLCEEIQRGELASCRVSREKGELERILRGKVSSAEYEAVVGPPRGLHSEESERGQSEPPAFSLSSIYSQRPRPVHAGETEEKRSTTAGEDLSTPHTLTKRNRGASVSVNASRRQLFPDTPQTSSRHRSGTAFSNGRIVSLLGKSAPTAPLSPSLHAQEKGRL
jgi:hypothetical protein